MREGLVVAEVGMSLILLAGAGLLVRTLWHLLNVDAGFNPTGVEVARIWLPQPNHPELDPYRKPEQRLAFNRELLRRISEISSVQEAALSSSLPLTGNQFVGRIAIEGRNTDPSDAPNLAAVVVSPRYFHVLQTPVIDGRSFEESDDTNRDGVVVVDRTAATRLWPGQNAIGHRVGTAFNIPKTRWFTIVGVVADIKQAGLDASPAPHIYFSLYQLGPRTLSVAARVKTSAGRDEETSLNRVGEEIKRQVQAVNPDLPVFGIEPMTDLVSDSLTARRFSAQLIGAFSLLALVLAGIGVYGVIAYWVAQRTRELGIRMALGAQPADVLKLVLSRGMRLAIFGVLAGLASAIAIAPLLRSQLYGISMFDPLVFVSVSAVLLGVALAAGCVPAFRAMQVDPVVALRYD
jgi:predicted permease